MTEESCVELRLSCQPLANDKYVIGNKMTNNFLVVPAEFSYILEYSDGSNSISLIQEKIYEKYGVFIDVLDTMKYLLEEDLVYACDGLVVGKDNKIESKRWLKMISNFLFSDFSIIIYIMLLIFTVYNLLFGKSINVDSINLIEGKPGYSLFAFMTISWFVTLIHELGHYLSGLKLGIGVTLRLSLRFCYLVAESDINGIWSVEKKQRDICYLGGIFFESILATICIFVQRFIPYSYAFKIANVVLLIISMNFLWQFIISMRTDIYLIILNHLEVPSLHKVSLKQFRECIKNKSISEMSLYNKLYIVNWLGGALFSIIYFVLGLRIYIELVRSMYWNIQNNSVDYIDMLFLFFFVLSSVLFWIVGARNKVREKNENRFANV